MWQIEKVSLSYASVASVLWVSCPQQRYRWNSERSKADGSNFVAAYATHLDLQDLHRRAPPRQEQGVEDLAALRLRVVEQQPRRPATCSTALSV